MGNMRIRYIDGDMPFDRDGKHATGREVAEWVLSHRRRRSCSLLVCGV